MKKIVSTLAASAVAVSSAVTAFAADTFTDVKKTGDYGWAYEYVENMAEKGLITGFEDGSFRPGNSVTRRDAFALFARIMGSNNEANAEIAALASEKYADVLEKYDLSYAEGDVAFMMSRGVLAESELDTYFAGTKKTEAMPRYEAAVLITKAMLAEEEATSEVLIDMDYTDVGSIPKSARQYVYYVSQKGIMSGMGNGEFSPNTSVRRSEIAVMMTKTIDSVNYYFEQSTLESVNTLVNNIKIKDFDTEIGYDDNTKFYLNGEPASEDDMKAGQNVVLTYNENDEDVRMTFVDIISPAVEKTVMGIFRGYSSVGGTVTLTVEDAVTGISSSYKCSPNVIVTINGAVSNVSKLSNGTYINMGLAGEKVAEISSQQMNETISKAELTEINPLGTITISHENEKYDGMTYAISNSARILKNGNEAEFSDLYRGDTLTLTLEYGVLTKVVAESKKSTVSGVLESYTMSASSNPTLTIKKDGDLMTYDIPSGVVITYNGETAKLSDFIIGQTVVTLQIESNAVTKIAATEASGEVSNTSITGVVTAVSDKTKAILLTYSQNGEEVSTHLTCKDTTRYYIIPSFSECALKDIKVGDVITAYGDASTGFFVCSAVTVTQSK